MLLPAHVMRGSLSTQADADFFIQHPADPRHCVGIGWGKAMPYLFWNDTVASTCSSKQYPFFPVHQHVRSEERHYTFNYSVADVGVLLKEWGYGHYQSNFRAAQVDGMKLIGFTDATLQRQCGMSDPTERADLLARIHRHFKSAHSFKRGDIVRLVLDLDAASPSLTLFRRQGENGAWAKVGTPLGIGDKPGSKAGAGKGIWRFAVTLTSPHDVVHFWAGQGSGETVPPLPKAKKTITTKRRGLALEAAGILQSLTPYSLLP